MSDQLDDLDRRLLDRIQQSVPLVRRPFAELGREFGIPEDEALRRVQRFAELGMVRRLGPIVNYPAWNMSGALVAAKLDPAKIEQVRAAVAEIPEVTHAYLREHEWNLWFTIIAETEAARDAIARRLGEKLGLKDVRVLPKGRGFKLGVRFET
jgi:DNA-binding Lrp family transcriptional regulator